MRTLVLVALVLSVIIDMRWEGLTGCPAPPRIVTRNADGTYSESRPSSVLAISCLVAYTWQEEWTDYPERGGVFIRDVSPSGMLESYGVQR